MNDGIPAVELIFTFPGNPRSERIIAELTSVRQHMRLNDNFTDETKYMALTGESPLYQSVVSGKLSAVALVDVSYLAGGKHLQFVLGRTRYANGLPGWAASARYICKVGSRSDNTRRDANQIYALFVHKFAERMAKYPLPWGPAKDPAAQRRKKEKKHIRQHIRERFSLRA